MIINYIFYVYKYFFNSKYISIDNYNILLIFKKYII